MVPMIASCADRRITRMLVAIPTFNNRATLRSVVERTLSLGFPVLMVNDGTTDGGTDMLEGLAIERIDFAENQGKGAAILSAGQWAEARGYTHVITMDADGQHNPDDVHIMVDKIAQNPLALIVGRRDFSDSDVPRASRFGRRFSNFWFRIASGVTHPDTQSGFRAYPVRVLTQVKCRARRYDYEVEILVRSVWAGVTLKAVDITVHYDDLTNEASHFDALWDNVRTSLTYTRLVTRNLIPWPHKLLMSESSAEKHELSLRHLRRSMLILLRESTAPLEIAAAAMLGIFLGTLPLVACHSVAIIFCAARLRLNRLVAFNVSHLCAPPVVPALAVEVGYYLRNGTFLTEFSLQTLGHEIHQRLLDYLIGSCAIAPILSLSAGGIVFLLARLYQSIRQCRGAPENG